MDDAHVGPQAALIADWELTTLYLNGGDLPDTAARTMLERRGVGVEPALIVALQGSDGNLSSLVLDDGREVAVDALFSGPQSRLKSPIAERLGCALDEGLFARSSARMPPS